MHPLAFIILAYTALALQIGLGPYIAWKGVAPNLILLTAVFIGMNASRKPALVGCFLLGLVQDWLSPSQSLGVYAFSYGLSALIVTGSAPVVYRDHPLTHVSLALTAGVIALFAVLISGALHPAGPATSDGETTIAAARVGIGPEFRRLVYTAALAPFLFWPMSRLRKMFAFKGHYRKGLR